MSQWTHVAGVVRLDALRLDDGYKRPQLGREIHWGETEYARPNDEFSVPEGSEGCLYVACHEDPDRKSLSSYTITVFGDLRDYDNEQEVVDYFNKLANPGISVGYVRQAIFTVDVEGRSEAVYRFEFENGKTTGEFKKL
jgi:hypothetical protein